MKQKGKHPEYDSFDAVFSYSNLYGAYRRCRRNVAWKASTQKYITQAPLNLYKTQDKLMSGRWRSQGFYEFDLCERGHQRHIKSVTFDERIVQRCLCDNALVPVLTRGLIYDNGAMLKGKGYHFAINRITEHLHWYYRHYGTDGYILLFDFRKFFESIPHQLCKQLVHKNFSDPRLVALIEHFIDNCGEVGLGLGSQISQTFALAAASPIDHYCKETMRVHCYARYNDDGYLIDNDKSFLKLCLNGIRDLCTEMELKLNEKKVRIVKLSHGFTFLKTHFFLTDTGKVIRKIDRTSVTRVRRKMKKFPDMIREGRFTFLDAYQSFQSWRSYALYFNAYHTVTAVTKLYSDLFLKEVLSGLTAK